MRHTSSLWRQVMIVLYVIMIDHHKILTIKSIFMIRRMVAYHDRSSRISYYSLYRQRTISYIVQVLADVDVALIDALDRRVVSWLIWQTWRSATMLECTSFIVTVVLLMSYPQPLPFREHGCAVAVVRDPHVWHLIQAGWWGTSERQLVLVFRWVEWCFCMSFTRVRGDKYVWTPTWTHHFLMLSFWETFSFFWTDKPHLLENRNVFSI